MCANEQPITEVGENSEVSRRTVLRRTVALGTVGTLLTSGTASAKGTKNRIVLQARSSRTKVRITVSGEIEKGEFAGDSDKIKDSNVAVSNIDTKGEIDSFRFSGEVTDFDVLEGDVKVTLNGKEVDPDTLGGRPLDNKIVLQARTSRTKVRITVSGEIEKGEFAGDSDRIKDSNVAVSNIDTKGEIDSFRFSGEITDFDVLKGDVKVTLNGKEVDSAMLPARKNDLVLQARTSRTKVRITVSGEIEKGEFAGDSDTIRENGTVAVSNIDTEGELDSFRFSGEVTDFDVLEGDVKVTLNGEEVEPSELVEPTELSLRAQGPVITYRFVVAGTVEPGPEADTGAGDEISGRTVTGNVAGTGVDDYLIRGSITEFSTSSDDVTVTLDGEEVGPDEVV